MTLTDALMGAAALWLLLVLCGIPEHRSRGSEVSWEETSFAWGASGALVDAAPFSAWYQEVPQPWHVTPPIPEDDALAGTSGDSTHGANIPENTSDSLGSTTVSSIGLSQMLSLTEVTISSGGNFTLANLGGSGLIVLESGWLELTERGGSALLTRSPSAEPTAPQAAYRPPTIAPGDRLTFGPGATIVLRNRSEHPARILTASVTALPGLEA